MNFAAQHSVHPPSTSSGRAGGSLRVFRQFVWLEVGSGKMALSRPAHQRVTLTVSQQGFSDFWVLGKMIEWKDCVRLFCLPF